ncbi:RIC1-domain-containing protein [Pyronema omphalodes]|nr:RIC1-domain-containing protein [Pyronema omphalodes]
MYWPIRAPTIFVAKVPPSSQSIDYDSEESAELVRHSLSIGSVPDDEGNEAGKEATDEEEDGRKIGEKEVEEDGSSSGTSDVEDKLRNGESESALGNGEETRSHLVALRVARSGLLFATITRSELTIWQTKPTAVVAHVRRSPLSINSYGPNIDVMIRPDSQIFVVQTSLGYLMTYSLATDQNARVYKPTFVGNHHHQRKQSMSGTGPRVSAGDAGILPGAGEAGGVREFSLQFRMVIKVDAGISKALALEDELMVATVKPSAIQCIRWTPDSTGNQTSAETLNRMPWMQKKVIITDMIYDRPMNLSTWVTNDGRAYAVQKIRLSENGNTSETFKGYCFHTPATSDEAAVKVAINARFSMIAVACSNGSLFMYTARDYSGNIPLSHKVVAPSDSPGNITFVSWSPDGYCLFVGYQNGWSTWSVYGTQGGNSFGARAGLIERKPNEAYLGGVKYGAWIANGGEILLLRNQGDELIWSLEFVKSAIVGCFSSVNAARPMLQTGEQLLIYRGYDQDDNTMISQDSSVLWHSVQVPASYLAENWPIRSSVISPDGRYVSVAGTRGLAHYSVNSGRWKTFTDARMEQDFTVRGGMCWFQHILIAAVECHDRYQLRLYSRELALDNTNLVHLETLPSAIVLITLTGNDSLLVYTNDNILYHYIVQSLETSVRLVQVGQITFYGIIRAPARVRAISWIVPDEQLHDGDPSRDVAVATMLFLVDGKLVLLQPSTTEGGELKYDMRVLLQNVEYYTLTRDQPPQQLKSPSIDEDSPLGHMFPTVAVQNLSDSLWTYDGTDVKVWIDVKDILEAGENGKELPVPVKVPVDFYPMSTLTSRGILVGIESELVQRRDIGFSLFKFSTRTHLFITHLLRHLLTAHQPGAAVELARNYEHLAYFSHALEVLLHDVLDEEADTAPSPEDAVLPEVNSFLTHFPHYLDVIVRCTRKTEVASWKHLFSVVGSPQALFEESLSRGLLKTAGGYLLILHTLEQLSSSSKDMVRLFARAVQEGDWDLCKELARFLTALDNSGKTLREALELVELRTPAEEKRSFMFGKGFEKRPESLDGEYEFLSLGEKLGEGGSV